MFKQILAHLMAPIYFDYQHQFSPRDFKMIIKKTLVGFSNENKQFYNTCVVYEHRPETREFITQTIEM